MEALLGELKEQGYHLFLMSNTSHRFRAFSKNIPSVGYMRPPRSKRPAKPLHRSTRSHPARAWSHTTPSRPRCHRADRARKSDRSRAPRSRSRAHAPRIALPTPIPRPKTNRARSMQPPRPGPPPEAEAPPPTPPTPVGRRPLARLERRHPLLVPERRCPARTPPSAPERCRLQPAVIHLSPVYRRPPSARVPTQDRRGIILPICKYM